MDNGEVTAVVFLDLAKAFNMVRHSLLEKLQAIRVRNTESDWFKSYLHDHQQRVVFNGTISTDRPVTCGIPQGSALGPLMFLIYINYLPDAVKHSKINMFADDTAIFLNRNKSNDIERKLNSDLQSITMWLEANGLVINASKTEYILIGTSQKLRTLDQCIIGRVETSKYLGVTVDTHLSWNPHVDKLYKKVSSRIGMMKRIRKFLDLPTSKLVYNATTLALLDCCDLVWDSCNTSSKAELQRLQYRAAKVILKADSTLPTDDLLHNLKWLKLEERRRLHKVTLMYKCLHEEQGGINVNFTRHMDIHGHNTRSKCDYILPKPITEQLKRIFLYSAMQIWNSIT